jgi:hypothetical protein
MTSAGCDLSRGCYRVRMLVFIDESGDPGFKLERGASPVFVAAMVIFERGGDAAATQAAIEQSEARRAHKGEFKFNKCSRQVRDMFFEQVRSCDFKVRAIVVRKELIRSARLRSDKEKFYEYFVKAMLSYDGDLLRNARVVIDGSGDRAFRQNLASAFRRRLKPGAIESVRFKSSHSDALLQLADMCAGAVARSYRDDRDDHDRWRKALAQRIDDIWEFK